MKRVVGLVMSMLLIFSCLTMVGFASEDSTSLDEVISSKVEENTTVDTGSNSAPSATQQNGSRDFIASLTDAADMSGTVEGVAEVNAGIKTVASWVIQVMTYAIITLLTLRVVLDLAYIGLPFIRTFLANGYVGNAQAGAGGMPNSMAGGMNGGMMGGPMGGGMMGGPMGGGMMGGPMGGGMYGRGGYGMNRMGGGMMGGMDGQANMHNQGGSIMGRIQWVSNAALNAVAAESSVGPDGKANSPFKTYCQDMTVMLVLVPILLTLAVTGTLTNLGFLLGDVIVDAIASIGDVI